jgi:hypothetical protein
MSSMIGDCMALFRDKGIRAKYEFYLKHGGRVGAKITSRTGKEFALTDKEKAGFIADYQKKIPIAVIAREANRSNDTVRRVLRVAGIYEVDRDKIANLIVGHQPIKTTYTNKK